jgi:CubicO group peptidase (beta-lactamase class C family)
MPIEELVDSFDRDLERLLRRDRVPGAAAALVSGGELVWERGAGVADSGTGAPVDRETVFQVASLSKPVTALGVLLLAQDGRLDLDRPVWDYIESWRPPPSPFDLSGVTARRLLSHRAGVGVHGYPGVAPERRLPTLRESLGGATGGAVELVAAPGGPPLYSSGGYTVLQLLVEEITGEPFAAFMERRVLAPLRMTRSSFEASQGASPATGHGWWGGRLPAYRFREQAASGLLSTAGDLARFLGVLVSREAQARAGVDRATVETLLEPGPGGGFAQGLAVEPRPTGGAPGGPAPGVSVVSHHGANRGFRAVLGAAPERGDGFVVLTNSDRGAAMTDDLMCSWGAWVSDVELASCWAERKRRGTMLAVAGLLGLGLMMDGAAFARRRWRLRREHGGGPFEAERHRFTGWVRLALSAAVALGWWLFWYTDRFALRREGIANHVPASSMPRTFFWLTAVLTAWCALGVARWLASQRRPAHGKEP